MDVMEIDGLSGGELLDHVESLAATQHGCEVEILRAAVQHAYLHHRDTLDPAETGKPGRERARRIGGAGRRRSPSSPPRSWPVVWVC